LTKNDYREYESFLELTKRLNISVNNQFMEMQKRLLLLNEGISEEGLMGEILVLVKKTFEDLANYALTYNKLGLDVDKINLG